MFKCSCLIGNSRKFSEALAVTSKAKAQFPHDYEDLFNRAEKLIRESVECGVTSIRSHVEVDKTVKFSCLDVGISLAAKWERTCDIQVVGEMDTVLNQV